MNKPDRLPDIRIGIPQAPRWEDEKTFALAAYQDATCHEKCPSSVVIRLAKFIEQQQARITGLEEENQCCHCGSKDIGFFTCARCETKEDDRYRETYKENEKLKEDKAKLQVGILQDAIEIRNLRKELNNISLY